MASLTDEAEALYSWLVDDLTDRRGLKQAWSDIPDDVVEEEIKPKWSGLIAVAMAAVRQDEMRRSTVQTLQWAIDAACCKCRAGAPVQRVSQPRDRYVHGSGPCAASEIREALDTWKES